MNDMFHSLEEMLAQGSTIMQSMRGSDMRSFNYLMLEKNLTACMQEYEDYIHKNIDQDLLDAVSDVSDRKGYDHFSQLYLDELRNQYDEKRLVPDRFFFDMDGVLYVFDNTIESLDVLYEEHYFLDLPQQRLVCSCLHKTLEEQPHQTFIVSHYLDSPYAKQEKLERLAIDFPQLDPQNILLVPYGESKADYIPSGIKANDYLLDDYNNNLTAWKEAGGHAVKLINGINDRHHTWQGDRLYYDDPKIVQELNNIVHPDLVQDVSKIVNEYTFLPDMERYK